MITIPFTLVHYGPEDVNEISRFLTYRAMIRRANNGVCYGPPVGVVTSIDSIENHYIHGQVTILASVVEAELMGVPRCELTPCILKKNED